MKIVVTHLSIDFDAITSIWLIKKYLPGWLKAEIKFVEAGKLYKNQPADSHSDIIYVDTGLGKFDHHQSAQYLSASKLVFDFLKEKKHLNKKDIDALERLINLVTFIDNFLECNLPNPSDDFYDLALPQIINGLKNRIGDDLKTINLSFELLDAVFYTFKKKIMAEKEIKRGFIFTSCWGKSLALESKNEEAVRLAQKLGYSLVVRKDLEKGWVRIKLRPDCRKGLDKIYNKVSLIDPKADWFFHASKMMLLNGSSHKKNN